MFPLVMPLTAYTYENNSNIPDICKLSYECNLLYEPHREKTVFFSYAKTKTQISFAVTAKLISAFVFATRIV